MTPEQLLAHAAKTDKHSFTVTAKAVQSDKQIVTGEVYAPYVMDSHGDIMLPEDIELMAHRFLKSMKNDQIDLQHNNKTIAASVVESYIARAGDPLHAEGAWVLSVKIDDEAVWNEIKKGEYSGYSFEAMVVREEVIAELEILNHTFGFTEEHGNHDHAYFVEMDDNGRVRGGYASKGEDGHTHDIRHGTATENSEDGHSHRYFLP